MPEIPKPIIHQVNYSKEGIEDFNDLSVSFDGKDRELLVEYPTVYVINDKVKKHKFDVYVGETTNISKRTEQHLTQDIHHRDDWEKLAQSKTSLMYIIGHEYFNKSLTLDIENKLMHYLSAVDTVENINNRRTNEQSKYFTSEYFDEIFSNVWARLREKNEYLFPLKEAIEASALFKHSPFHKLTDEQIDAKIKIKNRVINAVENDLKEQLILVSGEAGSGKTVLMSSLFYDLMKLDEEYADLEQFQNLKIHMLINHDAQLKVYQKIAKKLDLVPQKDQDIVSKPTRFINNTSPDEPVDVVVVDEAHLLWTRGKQSYRGKNQLYDLLERARVVVAVFDENQVLTAEQYWEDEELENIENLAEGGNNLIRLHNQMRIGADEQTVQWIRKFTDEQKVLNIPKDSKGYEIKIFEDPTLLHQAVKEKNNIKDEGISRLVATFDWKYKQKGKPENGEYWMVEDSGFKIPWNYEIKQPKKRNINYRNLSWAEQPHTINEAGSTYSIQGFDLNYVGVIIGPSVIYRDGQLQFVRENSENRLAVQQRTFNDGSKAHVADYLLKNELNVLLTRGVRGLYIYAVDNELQEALLKAQKGEL